MGRTRFTYDDIVAGQTYRNLTTEVQRCIDVGVFAPGSDPLMIATTLWAAAHGAVSLCLAKPDLAGDDAEALCSMIIEHAGLGAALASYMGSSSAAHGSTDPHDHENVSIQIAAMLQALAGTSPH
jgi:hypothetical protein